VTVLRAALVTPLGGLLAPYGVAGAVALGVWSERAANLPPPWTSVQLEVVDAHPSAAAAMRAATATRPDVVFGPYASGPAVAAMRATDRLVWNHGGATDRLSLPEFVHTVNIPAPASSYLANVLHSLHAADPTLHAVSLLHVQTGFGREVARGAVRTAEDLGLEVRTLAFEPGQAAESAKLLPRGDVLLVAGPFGDELIAARLLLERPWRAAGFVGAGVEEVLAPLGSLRDGLLGPCQWLAHAALPPDEGPDADWFVSAFRAATGGQEPPYPAASAFAAGVVCARGLREAGTSDDAALGATAAQLQLRTLFGKFGIDPWTGLQVGHQVLVVQWQEGARRVVWPPERAERAVVVRAN
jgi:branched-chain amino acid transport system substrate-binding protein